MRVGEVGENCVEVSRRLLRQSWHDVGRTGEYCWGQVRIGSRVRGIGFSSGVDCQSGLDEF